MGIVYLLRVDNGDEFLYKIGITKYTAEKSIDLHTSEINYKMTKKELRVVYKRVMVMKLRLLIHLRQSIIIRLKTHYIECSEPIERRVSGLIWILKPLKVL